MVSTLTEDPTPDVSVGEVPKTRPSLESLVSSADEDSQLSDNDDIAEDGRDDMFSWVADNGCLREPRNELIALKNHIAARVAISETAAPKPKSCETTKATSRKVLKKSSSDSSPFFEDTITSKSTQDDGSPFFDSICVQPLKLIVSATTQAAQTETQSTPLTDEDDDAEDSSIVTAGKIFDDLASLPSLASVSVKSPVVETEDANALLKEVDDLSLVPEEPTEDGSDDADSMITQVPKAKALDRRVSSSDSGNLEKAEEKKLNESLGEDEVLSDEDLKSAVSYSGSRKGSFPRVRSLLGRSEASELAISSDEQHMSPTEVLLKELRAAREEHGRYDVKCANLTSNLGDAFYKNREYNTAYGMYKEALSVYSAKLGDSHETTIDTRIHFGETLEKLGKYDAALQEYHTVLAMRKDINGVKDSSVADAMVMLSRALRQKEGRIPQALKELKRALKLYRASLGDSNPKVAATVDDIASLYMMNGDFVKATAILDEVVKLKAATSGMFNVEVGRTLTQLASAQQSSGDMEGALKTLKKAYSIFTSVSGEDSEETTDSLQKLAHYYMECGDYPRAMSACMGVLNRKKRMLGNADPSLADAYLDLGVCLQQTGDFNKASKCLKLSLTLCFGAKGNTTQDSGKIAHIMHELGTIHQLNGKPKDAVKVFEQELVVRRKMGPDELSQVARTLFHLGTAKYDLSDCIPALADLTEALKIYGNLQDDMGMDFAETLFSTGLVFKTLKHDESARQAFLESLKLFYAHGLGKDQELVQMATTKLKELGHKCECTYRMCTQVPCQSTSEGLYSC